MKRVITLMLALAMVFGAVANSSAADMKAKGQWRIGYDWTDNLKFADTEKTNKSEDDFMAQQRFRTQIDIVANENLSGVVFFEMDQTWGLSTNKAGSDSGGGIGADGVNIETKRAYLDWTVPNTALSVRMGIQGLALPGAVAGSPIMDNDVAATVATYKFNDMVSLTGFWARPYDTTIVRDTTGDSQHDELDMFGLVAGIKLDGMEFNPYAVYAAIGKDTSSNEGIQSLFASNVPSGSIGNGTNWGSYYGSKSHNGYYSFNGTESDNDSRAYWLGLGSTINLFDPIIFKFDAVYGAVDNSDYDYNLTGYNATTGAANATSIVRRSDDDINDRSGWMVDAKLSYKMDMVTPGVIAWYASGEDDDITNGSERMPVVSGAYSPTTFGFDGYTSFNTATGDLLGVSNEGKWAVGLLLEDIKVIDKLTSQFRVLYIEGTNDHDVVANLVKYTGISKSTFQYNNPGFMTDEDHAWEVNFDHKYDIYENLAMVVEMGYVNMDRDSDTWGTPTYDDDAYKLGVVFQYSF